MSKKSTVVLENPSILASICGANDSNLRLLEELLESRVLSRGNELTLEIDDEYRGTVFRDMLRELADHTKNGQNPNPDLIRAVFESITENKVEGTKLLREYNISVPGSYSRIFPKSTHQAELMKGMHNYDMIFCVGPAGTGKTYLAVAHALSEVISRKKRKLVLTRPVVEAGESLGFLPGDLTQKISPYLRPLYDAMEAILPLETINRMEENHVIEIAPLAYMRGRSLSNCFIILDEAQNTTQEQMKMFLTRLGENSKAVITGDITQIDLPKKSSSGLLQAIELLKYIDDIFILRFTKQDVVRNKLVQQIIQAYESKTE